LLISFSLFNPVEPQIPALIYNHQGQRLSAKTNDRFMKTNDTRRQVSEAIAACLEKKAEEIAILQRHQPPPDPGHRRRSRTSP
jgi:hypothetical protein